MNEAWLLSLTSFALKAAWQAAVVTAAATAWKARGAAFGILDAGAALSGAR